MPASAHGTLTAGQVARVTVDATYRGFDVVNRDQVGAIWVRVDGQDPTVEGAGSFIVLGARHFPYWRRRGEVEVAMVSDADRAYSVEGMV